MVELWAPDAEFVSKNSVLRGHDAIAAEAARIYDCNVFEGFTFTSGNLSQVHHNLVRIKWHMQVKDSGLLGATGSDLLVLDLSGRIRYDYQFDEPV